MSPLVTVIQEMIHAPTAMTPLLLVGLLVVWSSRTGTKLLKGLPLVIRELAVVPFFLKILGDILVLVVVVASLGSSSSLLLLGRIFIPAPTLKL